MNVEDAFTIRGRGIVATGRIERGVCSVGDEIEIVGLNQAPKRATIAAIEAFQKTLEKGVAGDHVGILIHNLHKDDIARGQVLAAPGTIKPHTKFEADVYFLPTSEGGRHTPFLAGYRPQFYFRNTDFPGSITSMIDSDGNATELCMPGHRATMRVELNPDSPIALEEGLRFAIREGGRTVGSGVVREIPVEKSIVIDAEAPSRLSGGKPEAVTKSAARHVNAWLEQGQLPLNVDAPVRIGVNIGAARQGTIGGGVFVEPDWGELQQLDLVITLSGPGARVTPTSRRVTLQKQGDTTPVFFDVVPRRAGKLELYLSIHLAKEMTLLEELVLSLRVDKAMPEVVT
jgi:hypothetical protein